MTKKKKTKPPLTVKLKGTLDDNLKLLTPPNPVFEFKVDHLVIVDHESPDRVIGIITEINDGVYTVQAKSGDVVKVGRDSLKKK